MSNKSSVTYAIRDLYERQMDGRWPAPLAVLVVAEAIQDIAPDSNQTDLHNWVVCRSLDGSETATDLATAWLRERRG